MNLRATSGTLATGTGAMRGLSSQNRVSENNLSNGRPGGARKKVKSSRSRQYVIIGQNQSYVKAVVKKYLEKGKASRVHESDIAQYAGLRNCFGILLDVDARPQRQVLIKDIIECAKIVGSEHGLHERESNLLHETVSFEEILEAYELHVAKKVEVDNDVLKNYKRSGVEFKKALMEKNKRLIEKKGKRALGRSQEKEKHRDTERDVSKTKRGRIKQQQQQQTSSKKGDYCEEDDDSGEEHDMERRRRRKKRINEKREKDKQNHPKAIMKDLGYNEGSTRPETEAKIEFTASGENRGEELWREEQKVMMPDNAKMTMMTKNNTSQSLPRGDSHQNFCFLPLPPYSSSRSGGGGSGGAGAGINGGSPFSTKPLIGIHNSSFQSIPSREDNSVSNHMKKPSSDNHHHYHAQNNLNIPEPYESPYDPHPHPHHHHPEEILNTNDLEIHKIIVAEKLFGIRGLFEYLLGRNDNLFNYLIQNPSKTTLVKNFISSLSIKAPNSNPE